MTDFSQWWWQAAGVDPGPDPGDPIGQSLRFRGGQSLSGHTGGSGTASVWIKRAKLGAAQTVMPGIAFDASDKLNSSVAVFRDPSAWIHVVVNANGTYVNGVSVASGSAISAGTIGTSCELYLAAFYFIDGQALEPTTFGRYNSQGVWVPVDPDGLTYGTNGFKLTFEDPSNIGKDYSPNSNDFSAIGFNLAPSGIFSADLFTDEPKEFPPDFNTTAKNFQSSRPATAGFDGNPNTEAAALSTPNISNWIVFRPSNPIRANSSLVIRGRWTQVYAVNEIEISGIQNLDSNFNNVDLSPGITFPIDIENIAIKGLASVGSEARFCQIIVDGIILFDNTGEDYDLMQDSPTQNFAVINPLYPGASTSKANITTANTTGKPTILGLAGNVGVDSASVAWDGTEAGWNSTGAINFGQQPGAFDEISTRTMPTDPLPDEITGTFTGNNNANGPFVYTGCIPGRIQYGSVDVAYDQRLGQTNVDFLGNGFKVRSTNSNSGTVNYTVTTTHTGGEYDGKKIPFYLPAPATSN